MTMRIGFVTGEYPPMQGGVGDFTRELALAMTDAGHKVFIHTKQAAQPEAHNASSIEVRNAVKRWGWRTLHDVRRWANKNQLDVVNVQFQTAAFNMHPAIHLLPQRLTSIPVIVTFHDLLFPYLFPKAGPLRKTAVRRLARTSDLAIVTDRADEEQLRKWQVAPLARIPIGSNVNNAPPPGYDRSAWRSELGISDNTLLVGYFGFLNATKGGLELIEALKILLSKGIEAHLLMIGGKTGASDPSNITYSQMVEEKIAAVGLQNKVHWTGFVDDLSVSGHFLATDVVALPYKDGASLQHGTLMATLAHGKAIVTTQPTVLTPELTEMQSIATISAPVQPEELAKEILRLWNDSEERSKLEHAAFIAADQFRWESIARRTLAEYQKLVGLRE